MGMFDYVDAPEIECPCGRMVGRWRSNDQLDRPISMDTVNRFYSNCDCGASHWFMRESGKFRHYINGKNHAPNNDPECDCLSSRMEESEFELKPCPLCKAIPSEDFYSDDHLGEPTERWEIVCRCGLSLMCGDKEDTRERWNKRWNEC